MSSLPTVLSAADRRDDVADFARSAGDLLDARWGTAVSAGASDAADRVADLVKDAVQQGWFELAGERAVDFLVALLRELGRRSCPVPVLEAYVVATAYPQLADRVAAGAIVPAVHVGRVPAGEVVVDGTHATHVLSVDPAEGVAALHDIAATTPAPGLPAPAWVSATLGCREDVGVLDPSAVEQLVAVLRVGVAARSLAAAARAHELAVEHACRRRQFGRVIGAFGAVQQRTATAHIELTAGVGLVDEAVARMLGDHRQGSFAAAMAGRFAQTAAPLVLRAAQHTLGAVGYFDEHEAAWLFRRVHAEASLLGGGLADGGRHGIAARLLAEGGALPALDLGTEAEAFRAEVHALLERHRDGVGHDAEALREEMAAARLFSLGWPEAEGGRSATIEQRVVLHEEMKYAGGPVDRAMSATMLIGHALLGHGTPEQRAEFLPLLAAGRMAFCLGYSEPEAGSDLASLRTRAVRDGDGWVISGQKLWTTRAHTASHVWLAVRTDPDATPRHAGITIFLVPMDTPGITVQQHTALSGEISCTVFYDDVRVPDSARVGEVHGGWRVITDALAAERVVMGGVAAVLRRQLDEIVAQLRTEERVDDVRRDRLAGLATRLQAARVLVLAATRSMDGGGARIAGPMAAVLSGDLAEDFGRAALDLLGPAALLAAGTPGAPANGRFEAALRLAPMFVIGGGTNDVQRGIIARALGLPRE